MCCIPIGPRCSRCPIRANAARPTRASPGGASRATRASVIASTDSAAGAPKRLPGCSATPAARIRAYAPSATIAERCTDANRYSIAASGPNGARRTYRRRRVGIVRYSGGPSKASGRPRRSYRHIDIVEGRVRLVDDAGITAAAPAITTSAAARGTSCPGAAAANTL